MKSIFTKAEVESIAPSVIKLPEHERHSLNQIIISGLRKLISRAQKMRYSKNEMIIAWDEALERKLCDIGITENEEINFQEALNVYFEHLSCNDMKLLKETFISLIND